MLVNVWEGQRAAGEAAAYCARWGIEATVLLDEDASYARALGVRGVPTNVYVDAAGTVLAVGATTSEELLAHATRLDPRVGRLAPGILAAERRPARFGPESTG